MFFNRSDSYYYSRPISYRSYYPKLTRPDVLQFNDQESFQVCGLLKSKGIQFNDLGGLARGIRFDDLEVGKRHYNHNSYRVNDEYYIHQWKSTNDLGKQHPTGTHIVTHSFSDFMARLIKVIDGRSVSTNSTVVRRN